MGVNNFTGSSGENMFILRWDRPIDYGYSGNLYKYTLDLGGNMSGTITITNTSTTGYIAT